MISADEMGFKLSTGPKRQFMPEGEEWKLEETGSDDHYSLMFAISMEQPLF
jgi:hypothetical protein